VRSELASPYEMHRTVLRAFPSEEDGGPGRVLFRVDQMRHASELALLVQSDKEPDWAALDGNRTATVPYLLRPVEFKELKPKFSEGQQLAFRLRANPTRKIDTKTRPDGNRRNGKRVGIYDEQKRTEWLRRKGESGGFAVLSVQVISDGFIHGKKTDEHGSHDLKHCAVRFEGVVQVTDPDVFLQTLQTGIGSGKAFGFGLLSVAPVPS